MQHDVLAPLNPAAPLHFRAHRRARPSAKKDTTIVTSTPTAPAGAPRRPPPVRRKRGEGQWALGYSEPLNKNEQTKKDDNPLNVRARIENIYSKRGFDSIDPADLRGRFRWMGLYTQRAPGFDGGKTAMLEEEELDDRYFMMRVRTDGQVLGVEQLRALGETSTTYARNTADITDRNNIQYHWIEVESVPAIWERLESVGLITVEACGDSPRPFLGSPVAGIAKDEIIDGSSALAEIKARAIGNPEFSNLPRKFKTALTGHPSHDVAPEVNDVSFVGTVHPEHGPGFDLWVGGGLSTNPMLAQKLGRVDPARRGRRRLGGRRVDLPRLRLPPAALQGAAQVPGRRLGRGEVPRGARDRVPRTASSSTAPPPRPRSSQGDHIGIHEQKDGKFYVGAAPVVGRIDGTTLTALADLVEQYGALGARLTAYQKLVVLGVDAADTEAFADGLERIGLTARPSNWRRSTMACTGIEFCKLAIVDTKERARLLVTELEKRFPELDTPISINVNGCPNACARTQVADIGLKGQLVLDEDGNQVEGFQVHLGGALGLQANFGRKLRAHKVDQRRPRRLRDRTSSRRTSPTAPTASRSRPGPPAPTRSTCAARSRGRGS